MLKRVSIQNFKSLKDITLDLQKVNLLIGPNNSGKTNFLKALEFFSLALKRTSNNKSIEFTFKHKGGGINIIFSKEDFDKYSERKNIENLALQINSNRKNLEHWYSSNPLDIVKTNPTIFLIQEDNFWDSINNYIDLDLSMSFHEKTFYYKDVPIYKPDTNKLDKPAPIGRGDNFVAADTSNLIAFFDKIRDEYPNVFDQIKTDLAKCVPEFTEINFQNIASTEELVKQFGDKTFKRIGLTNGKQKTIYWADELSEGTLYFLALLCIINQPNPPKLLLLEEPEKGIHPRRIHEVIQFIFRLVEEKDIQVIMTTHSPVVLDMFAEMPESVFIFDKDEEGATHVKNLQRDVIEPDTAKSKELGIEPPRYTDALGDSWTIGFLGGVPK